MHPPDFMWQALRFWFFRLWIIDCVGCGSLVVHGRGLCLQCECEILDQYLNPVDQVEELEKSGLRLRYLFSWVPGASDILSRYVYLLKSYFSEPLWHELARFFSSQNEGVIHKNLVFVPIPSRKKRRHSLYFSQALAEQCGGRVLELLVINPDDQAEQKVKSREQRHKIRFSLNEEITKQLSDRSNCELTLIIVDDVITTGASYEAAYNVLKTARLCPKNIELWAAFRRESMSIILE